MSKLIRWLTAVGFTLVTGSAGADVITFTGGPPGIFVGPTVEGAFTYNTQFGGLVLDDCAFCGNPPPDMEGLSGTGGILRVVRTDGGLFTFDGVDAAQNLLGATTIRFRGVKGGLLQAVDDLATTGADDDFAGGSQNSVNLLGVTIDELLIELDSPPNSNGFEEVDNIRLTQSAVPVPATAWLLLLGAGLLVGARRR